MSALLLGEGGGRSYSGLTHLDTHSVFFGVLPLQDSLRARAWTITRGLDGSSWGGGEGGGRLISPLPSTGPAEGRGAGVRPPSHRGRIRRMSQRHQRDARRPSPHSPLLLVFQGLTAPPPPPESSLSSQGLYDYLGSTSSSRLPLQDPFNAPSLLTPRNRPFRLVACLTSLPHRLPGIGRTIQSLLDQHVPADAIYLNLPRSYVRFKESLLTVVPESLRRLPITINMVDVDYGPATKLIPTLIKETDPSTVIITVDDDMIFKPTLFGLLLRRHMNNPRMAYGNAGQMIDTDGKFGPAVVRTAWQWKDNDYPVDILEAFRGAIYSRSFFQDLSEVVNISTECFFTDDIWISAFLARRRIPRIKVVEGWGDTAEFAENDNITPLRNDNVNGTKRNDLCALSLLADFKSGWSNTSNETCSFEFERLQ